MCVCVVYSSDFFCSKKIIYLVWLLLNIFSSFAISVYNNVTLLTYIIEKVVF